MEHQIDLTTLNKKLNLKNALKYLTNNKNIQKQRFLYATHSLISTKPAIAEHRTCPKLKSLSVLLLLIFVLMRSYTLRKIALKNYNLGKQYITSN